jgi:glycerol-3-phosphate acyltransferase PlsY
MSQRRVSSPVPYIVAVLLAFLGTCWCSYLLFTGGKP